MASGTIRLKSQELIEKFNKTMYRIEKNGAASRPTVLKYMGTPEQVEYLSARVLYGILVDGFELSPEDVANMRFGDVFELIPDESS